VVLLFDFGEAAWADLWLCQFTSPHPPRSAIANIPRQSSRTTSLRCVWSSSVAIESCPLPPRNRAVFGQGTRLRTHRGNPESWRGASYLPKLPHQVVPKSIAPPNSHTTTHKMAARFSIAGAARQLTSSGVRRPAMFASPAQKQTMRLFSVSAARTFKIVKFGKIFGLMET
jgi:hypothetical protein